MNPYSYSNIKRNTLRKLQVFGTIQDRDERSCRPGLSYVDGLLLLQDPYREICIPPLKELSLSPMTPFRVLYAASPVQWPV